MPKRPDRKPARARNRPGSLLMTLWDLLQAAPADGEHRPRGAGRGRARVMREEAIPAPTTPSPMQDRYDEVTRQMLERYGLRVRKWRTTMSGVAWTVTYRDGTVKRLIEAPRPRGPMSAAIFLHEVGHHVIGLETYRPRCLEEYHAWRWSLEAMEASGLNVTDAVRRRVHLSLWYAVAKARRRGLKVLPPELEPYELRPARPARARGKG